METHAAGRPNDQELLERIEQLQLRVEQLEDIVLSDDEPVEAFAIDRSAATAPGRAEIPPAPSTVTVSPRGEPGTTDPDVTQAPHDGTSGRDTADPQLPEPQRAAEEVEQLPAVPAFQRATAVAEPPATGFDLAYVEERLAGRALALAGGAALILGTVFFLSLAFSRGWIGPELQVAMGAVGGSLGLAIGSLLLVRGDRLVGHVLTAVGLAVISLSVFAATTLYELIDPAAGLLAIMAVAGATTFVAVWTHSQIVAGFGLVAVLAAPPVLGAPVDELTLGYMVVVLGGVATVSLWQTWVWLPPLAFAISAPQVAAWIGGDPAPELAAVALLAYWLLMAASAGGEAFRRARPELSLPSAPLLLAAGAFVVAMAFITFPEASQRFAFLMTLAALHALVAAWFVVRRGPVDPFGLLVATFGVALATMAIPLVLGASMTAVVWSAEAATLAVLAGRRAHGPSLLGGLALWAIASARIAGLALDARSDAASVLQPVMGPLDTLVVGWGFFLLAGALAILSVPSLTVRLSIVAVAALATIPVVDRELDAVMAVAAWSALALSVLAAPRWSRLLPERTIDWQLGPALEWLRPGQPLTALAIQLSQLLALIVGAVALGATVLMTLTQVARPEVPFSDAAGQSALILAAASVAGGLIEGGPAARRLGIIAALAVLALSAVFQLTLAATVVAWAGLAAVAFGLGRLDRDRPVAYVAVGAAIIAAAAFAALTLAPPDRLTVSFGGVPPHPLLVSEATVVIGAVALALAFAGRTHAGTRWSDWALSASGVALLYLLSIGVVDVFAAEAQGLTWRTVGQLDVLSKQAHVALSVLWSVVGVLVTGAGLLLRRPAIRVAGLTVLALATGKVFIIDLASLDVAYRVITLIVLGVLLIASALAWTRLKPGPPHVEAVPEPGLTGSVGGAREPHG